MIYDAVLNAVIDMAEAASGQKIVIGDNPPLGKISMNGFASPSSIFLDIGSNERMTVSCNAKGYNQQEVAGMMNAIHDELTRRKDYPQGFADLVGSGPIWQIYSIETVASPRLIGKEANPRAAWLYGSTLLVKFNVKGI